MAVTNYEQLDTVNDVTNTRTLLHESIPLTGTIIKGTYGTFPNEGNIKNFSHGQFQSVYDYPFLSSSANHIFDLTIGFDESSGLSGSTSSTQESKKINMYNQFSQVLLGYTGSDNQVREFELDTTLDGVNTMKEAMFVNFSRLITKDQIKKGTVSITLGTGSHAAPFSHTKILTDASASDTQGTANTLGGDYGVLFDNTNTARGLVFYQAGMIALSTSSFDGVTDFFSSSAGTSSIGNTFVSSSITSSCDSLRNRVQNISFNNTTEINSSIYFCRVPHNKYNHSSNPTYTSNSTIRVKSVNTDQPVAYITTIGLYSSDNELLAVAKLSEPLRKDPTNELTLRVRLDY
tara:strand:- start:330 stop:1370 length:1041 start_codon:yes stop_codon:yes gene_type:complete